MMKLVLSGAGVALPSRARRRAWILQTQGPRLPAGRRQGKTRGSRPPLSPDRRPRPPGHGLVGAEAEGLDRSERPLVEAPEGGRSCGTTSSGRSARGNQRRSAALSGSRSTGSPFHARQQKNQSTRSSIARPLPPVRCSEVGSRASAARTTRLAWASRTARRAPTRPPRRGRPRRRPTGRPCSRCRPPLEQHLLAPQQQDVRGRTPGTGRRSPGAAQRAARRGAAPWSRRGRRAGCGRRSRRRARPRPARRAYGGQQVVLGHRDRHLVVPLLDAEVAGQAAAAADPRHRGAGLREQARRRSPSRARRGGGSAAARRPRRRSGRAASTPPPRPAAARNSASERTPVADLDHPRVVDELAGVLPDARPGSSAPAPTTGTPEATYSCRVATACPTMRRARRAGRW